MINLQEIERRKQANESDQRTMSVIVYVLWFAMVAFIGLMFAWGILQEGVVR